MFPFFSTCFPSLCSSSSIRSFLERDPHLNTPHFCLHLAVLLFVSGRGAVSVFCVFFLFLPSICGTDTTRDKKKGKPKNMTPFRQLHGRHLGAGLRELGGRLWHRQERRGHRLHGRASDFRTSGLRFERPPAAWGKRGGLFWFGVWNQGTGIETWLRSCLVFLFVFLKGLRFFLILFMSGGCKRPGGLEAVLKGRQGKGPFGLGTQAQPHKK